jgi:acetyl-CoA carboxylase biotin carboxyl carrier protein
MSKDKPEQRVFDVERIRELIELMKEHELSEVDLRQDMQRIRLKRGGEGPVMVPAPVPVAAPASSTGATDASAPAEADDENTIYITSPTVGTFYSKPKPDSATFVKVGDVVDPDTIVCLVEAMKMFNEIPAGVSGKIVSCLVKNEDSVEVNKPLFKVVPV